MIINKLRRLLRDTVNYHNPEAAEIRERLEKIVDEEEADQKLWEDELPFFRSQMMNTD